MDNSEVKQLAIDALDGPHREVLETALSRVLSTEIAEVTYAQIIDGLPLAEVAKDRGTIPHHDHPIHDVHKELCPGVLDKIREFRNDLSPDIIQYDSRLFFAYLASPPGSRAFNTRLIELLAVTVHQIAVYLFNLDLSVHRDDGITEWVPPESDESWWRWNPKDPSPTMFNHAWYQDSEQYPNGIADIVGYWAENRILGGVVLFDRHNSDNESFESDAVYLHPDRDGLTYRICRLLPEQKQALITFISNPQSGPNPLPILPGKENQDRVDPEEPIEETFVYRDIWERKFHPALEGDRRLRHVWDKLNFPTRGDRYDAADRARERKWMAECGEEVSE